MFTTLQSVMPNLPRNFYTRTRGNSLKLMHVRSRFDQRKFSFCLRVVDYWDSLPDYVVKASSINMFKNRLKSATWCYLIFFTHVNSATISATENNVTIGIT